MSLKLEIEIDIDIDIDIDIETLKKSLLSWPVAATLKTDSAAPTVLAKEATIVLAVSWEICHSRGSTGTLKL